MNDYRGFRDALRSYVPIWLQNRPGFQTGYSILYVCAMLVDCALTWIVQAVYSWFPGYSLGIATTGGLDPTTALPLVGQSRGIIKGESETWAAYAKRLITWIEDWEQAGSSEILAEQIQAYLGNTPMVRIVDRAGQWVTIDQSGNITSTSASWDWDSVSNPERAGWWSDLWIIVYPCEWPVTGTALSSLVGLWGTGQLLGNGHAVPAAAVQTILTLLAQWKGAHAWCVSILWSYDSTLFVPGSPVSGDPDGTWGNWAYYSGNLLAPTRTGHADGRCRYWIPATG